MTDLKVTLCDVNDKDVELIYTMYDNSAAQKFIQLFQSTSDRVIREQSVMADLSKEAAHQNMDKLASIVTWLNQNEQITLPQVDYSVTQATLNQLHREFEMWGERLGPHRVVESMKTEAGIRWMDLNTTIHNIEPFLSMKSFNKYDVNYMYTCSFLPSPTMALDDDDYELFQPGFAFGELYMGYHTQGKNFLSAFWNNDLDVVQKKMIAPQRFANTEILGSFGRRSNNRAMEVERFQDWWTKHDINQYGYRMDDKKTLALGWLPIGRMKEKRVARDVMDMFMQCRSIRKVELI